MPYEVKGDLHCHEWTGRTTANGVPVIRTKTSSKSVRKLKYEREFGPVPDGFALIPLCGNRLCVRPLHAEPINRTQQAKYAGITKRHPVLDRAAMRLLRAGQSKRSIAKILDVSERTVRDMVKNAAETPGDVSHG